MHCGNFLDADISPVKAPEPFQCPFLSLGAMNEGCAFIGLIVGAVTYSRRANEAAD